jgi:hypothetical protein
VGEVNITNAGMRGLGRNNDLANFEGYWRNLHFLLAVSIRATFRAILWLMEKRAVPIAKPNIAVHKCDPPGRELRHVE